MQQHSWGPSPTGAVPGTTLDRHILERQRQTREYDAFLRAKVDTARAQIASGQYASDADVEARFAARRSALRAKVGGAEA